MTVSLTDSKEDGLVPIWTFGDRLRKARVHAGLERIEMAEQLHVSLSSVGGWENDDSKPRDKQEIVNLWAEATGVDRAWLMFGEKSVCTFQSLDMPDGQMELALGVAPRHLAVASR